MNEVINLTYVTEKKKVKKRMKNHVYHMRSTRRWMAISENFTYLFGNFF